MVSFLIDAALAVMLVTATAYLVIVNKRLKLLRTGQSEINALVSTFSKSIDDTDASMKRMVASATEIADTARRRCRALRLRAASSPPDRGCACAP